MASLLGLTACTYETTGVEETVSSSPDSPVASSGQKDSIDLTENARPNIVFILVDDLGINDLSYNPLRRSEDPTPPIQTPFIDSIARGGATLTQTFATHATCAPSRAGMLTGRYQHRFGFEFNPGASGALADILADRTYFGVQGRRLPKSSAPETPQTQVGLPSSEVTIAEALKEVGYRTGHFGKWHLGSAPEFRPRNHGFDHSVGFYGGASRYAPADSEDVVSIKLEIDELLWDMIPYSVMENGSPKTTTTYQTDLWANEAITFIEAESSSPFFAFVAFNAPHNPLQAPKDIYERLDHIPDQKERVYNAMVLSLDEAVGRILQSLEAQGLRENTIVVFASDNGGPDYTGLWTHNAPLRGYKGTFWEGGIRTPLFIQWPGQIEPGLIFSGQTSLMDLFATFSHVAGSTLPGDRIMDSQNLLPYLLGSQSGHPQDILFWRSGSYKAVRTPDYKLKINPHPAPERSWLYATGPDADERVNLETQRPDIRDQLDATLQKHFSNGMDPAWGIHFQIPIQIDPPDQIEPTEDPPFVYVSGG